MLRDADHQLGPALERTLGELRLARIDDAVATLAQRYAQAIDDTPEGTTTEVLANLGPKLLATLQAMHATPAARARVKSGGGVVASPNRLQNLRATRRA